MAEVKDPKFKTNSFTGEGRQVLDARYHVRGKSILTFSTMLCRLFAAITLLFCARSAMAAKPESAGTTSPVAAASASPTVAASPLLTPTATGQVPSPLATATPGPSASPVIDPFEEGLKQLMQASQNGFRDLHGKLKKTERGSGPQPLFRLRKIYEGTFLFGGAVSAEIEEVYFHTEEQPVYNYRLYFQALSSRESIERYDDFRQDLNHMLQTFEHTFGDRFDAWASHDPLKTAILLSSEDLSGSPEIQVHVAFASPQW